MGVIQINKVQIKEFENWRGREDSENKWDFGSRVKLELPYSSSQWEFFIYLVGFKGHMRGLI